MQRLSVVAPRRLAITAYLNVAAVLGDKPTDAEKLAFWALGDVNKDGVIDFADLTTIADAYGSAPGSPNWNPDCDLNQDGKVDMFDMAMASVNYGKTIKTANPIDVDVKISGPGINKTVKTPATVTLTSEGTYTLICGGQTKIVKVTVYDDGKTWDTIFYLTELPGEFPWWIFGLLAAGVVLAVVVSGKAG